MRLPPPSYANVMSTVAVFIALGGTSFAAVKLSKGSVGERELKKSSVTSEKLRDGTITPADLAAGTAVSGPRGPRGADGPAGASGAAGPSDAWHTSGVADAGLLSPLKNQAIAVARLTNLPPGSYVFHGSVSITDSSATLATVYCVIAAGGKNRGTSVGTFGNREGGVGAGTLAQTGSATITTSFDATLDCWNGYDVPSSAVPGFQQIGLSAIRVGTLR